MNYIERVNLSLKPKIETTSPVALDLFAGCGGLSLGFEAAGFSTIAYEMLADATETYNANLKGVCYEEKLALETVFPQADIIIGGPPCQPFSVWGKQKGKKDDRDGFPIFIKAVRDLQPKLFLIENVRGLLYKNKPYLMKNIDVLEQLGYNVDYRLLNAKYYDVPQNRERIFIVGHKGEFQFPKQLNKVITAGDALGELAFQAPENSKFLTKSMDEYIAKYEKASHCVTPRDLHLHKPARTLTCRNLAGATSDMHRVKLADGRRRRIFTYEASRLQSFPDWFEFKGTETSIFNQIGNSVPPMLAFHLANSVKNYLENPTSQAPLKKQPKQLTLFS